MVFPGFFLWNYPAKFEFPRTQKSGSAAEPLRAHLYQRRCRRAFFVEREVICEKHIKKIFLRFRRENLFPKKVGRKPKRHKSVYKRAVCPFLGKEMLRNECAGDFSKKAAASCISLAAAWRRRRDSNPRSASHALLP